MNKVFNLSKIEQFLEELQIYFNISFITKEDIFNKNVFKLIKDLKKIQFASSLFKWLVTEQENQETIISMVERFFPNKIGEIKQAGRELIIDNFYYNIEDNKIYCKIRDDGIERTLKIHTDLYEERTEQESKKMISWLNKRLDKFYGYFFVEEDNEEYITDMNIHNGKKRELIIFKKGNRLSCVYCVPNNSFGYKQGTKIFVC
jgi:hypothetical protein